MMKRTLIVRFNNIYELNFVLFCQTVVFVTFNKGKESSIYRLYFFYSVAVFCEPIYIISRVGKYGLGKVDNGKKGKAEMEGNSRGMGRKKEGNGERDGKDYIFPKYCNIFIFLSTICVNFCLI